MCADKPTLMNRVILSGVAAAFMLAAPAAAKPADPAGGTTTAAGLEPVPASIEAGSRQARALILAKLIVPEDLVLEREMALAKQAYQAAIQANSEARRLEAAHPGLYAAAWAEAAPELRRLASEGKPRLWASLAAGLEPLLTADETEALIGFYSTSVGRKIVRLGFETVNSYPDDSRPAAPADVQALVGREFDTFTSEDEAALLAVRRVVGGDKVKTIFTEARRVARAWRLENEPGQQDRGDIIIGAAVKRQIASLRPRP